MNFQEAIASGFRNYVTFSGRASRSEYWYWVLFAILAGVASSILDAAMFSAGAVSPINSIVNLVLFLPGLAVSVRRLHDIGRTGWWLLISLTIIGIIVLIVWFCQKSDAGSNAYGAAPAGV